MFYFYILYIHTHLHMCMFTSNTKTIRHKQIKKERKKIDKCIYIYIYQNKHGQLERVCIIWRYIKNGFVRLGWLAAILGYLRGLLVWVKTILTNWNTYVNHLNLFQNLRTFCFRPDAFVMCVSTFGTFADSYFLVLPLTKLSRKQIFAFFYTFNLVTSVVLVFAAATCFTLTPLHTITWGFGSC